MDLSVRSIVSKFIRKALLHRGKLLSSRRLVLLPAKAS